MEFGQKLQSLRKRKGLTQEALAQTLYVSRTAVSKWESGRGYPGIDSLKAIAQLFSVSIDELLSGEELVTLAQENTAQAKKQYRGLVFGLLDCCFALFLFLPVFGQQTAEGVRSTALFALVQTNAAVMAGYLVCILGMTVIGAAALALPKALHGEKVSLVGNALTVLVFIVTRQVYAAALALVFLLVKALLPSAKAATRKVSRR